MLRASTYPRLLHRRGVSRLNLSPRGFTVSESPLGVSVEAPKRTNTVDPEMPLHTHTHTHTHTQTHRPPEGELLFPLFAKLQWACRMILVSGGEHGDSMC